MDSTAYLIDTEITTALISVGIQANLQGYDYLKEAVFMTLKEPTLIHKLTKELYPAIAEIYGSNPAVVERSIRHAIDCSYQNKGLYGLNELLDRRFYYGEGKPCSGFMIALLREIVKKNLLREIAKSKNDAEKEELIRELTDCLYDFNKDDRDKKK